MKFGVSGNSIPNNSLIILLVILLSISLHSNCSLIPELDNYRTDKITRGPEYSPYYGLKKRIAVLDFLGKSKTGFRIKDALSSKFNV